MLLRLVYNGSLALAFLISYRLWGVYAATVVLMAGVTLEVGYVLARGRRPSNIEWAGLSLVIVLGGATLVFGDALFIEWRPTGFYWLVATALAVPRLWAKVNPIQVVLGARVTTSARVWDQVLWAWVIFNVLLGVMNLVVAYNFSLDTWVNYRVFGAPTLSAIMFLATCAWRRHDLVGAWRIRRQPTPGDTPDDAASSVGGDTVH
jgi:intracellular septation protein